MLNAVSEILEMIGVQSVGLNQDFSIDDIHGDDGLKQAIQNKKCPVINVINRRTNEVRILKNFDKTRHVIRNL